MPRSHSAIASALIDAGYSTDFVKSMDIAMADETDDVLLSFVFPDIPEEEEFNEEEENTTIIYRTQQDSKVDDKICLPQEGDAYDLFDGTRPIIPDDNHPNCRCFWEDAETGENLGQF